MKKTNKKGFTLTELIVVIAIIGILAAILIPTLVGFINRAKESNTQVEVQYANKMLERAEILSGKPKNFLEARAVLTNGGYDSFLELDAEGTYAFWNSDTNRVEIMENNNGVIQEMALSDELVALGTGTFTEPDSMDNLVKRGTANLYYCGGDKKGNAFFKALYNYAALDTSDVAPIQEVMNANIGAIESIPGLKYLFENYSIAKSHKKVNDYYTEDFISYTDNKITIVSTSRTQNYTELKDKVILPTGMNKFAIHPFLNNETMKKIIIPTGINSIPDNFFANTALENVLLPNTLTSIGREAFSGCTALKNVIIPDSVTTTGTGVFKNCTSLESVTISRSMHTINSQLFSGCSNLVKITIPQNINKIYNEVFSSCSASLEVVIENSMVEIEGSLITLGSSTPIITVNISENETQLSKALVKYKPYIKKGNVTYSISDNDMEVYAVEKDSKKVVIEKSFSTVDKVYNVTGINMAAFSGCSNLENINIPNTITSIDPSIFQECTDLDTWTSSVELCVILNSAATNSLKDKLKNITISGGEIATETIKGWKMLETIVIGNSVTSIAEKAFSRCVNLKNAYIPKNVVSLGATIFYLEARNDPAIANLQIECQFAEGTEPDEWNPNWNIANSNRATLKYVKDVKWNVSTPTLP